MSKVKENDRFKKVFRALPPQALAVVAARAALRILPIISHRYNDNDEAFSGWPPAYQSDGLSSLFHALQVLFYVNSLRSDSERTAFEKIVTAARDDAEFATRYADDTQKVDQRYGTTARSVVRAAMFTIRAINNSVAYGAEDTKSHFAPPYDFAEYAAFPAMLHDMQRLKETWFGRLARLLGLQSPNNLGAILQSRLWPTGMTNQAENVWRAFSRDTLNLNEGFEVWIDWYQDRLAGRPMDGAIEGQWAQLSEERLAQRPTQINAYLRDLRTGGLTKQLKRVRAIFMGNGEVGKTSLIRALHGEAVIEGSEGRTRGIALRDSIQEEAGVFTRVTNFPDDDLTIHFWDFGGQVMAHATHQFFLRSNCLYVIVLARPPKDAGWNPDEEADYWLEHVRAYGGAADALIVGNKMDIEPIDLNLRSLKEKYEFRRSGERGIKIDFFPLSCLRAKTDLKDRFEVFKNTFVSRLRALGEGAELFSPAQFRVLKILQERARQEDFITAGSFDKLCIDNGIAMEGSGGRDDLLDIFDKLGIVMHFDRLPDLADYVLNPRWLTYGVYTILYSEEAMAAKGRVSLADIVRILKKANTSISEGRVINYPPDRCHFVAEAMIALKVAYRLGESHYVIPALLPSEEPAHRFTPHGALASRFEFGEFLPRHLLPAFIVDHYQDIVRNGEDQLVWQQGVILRPTRRLDAEALVRADYRTPMLLLLVSGTDAKIYLCLLRDWIERTIYRTMPELPVEEKVQLRSDMRVGVREVSADNPIWISYNLIKSAERNRITTIAGPDGHSYDLERILAAMPAQPEFRQADVFLSYEHEDKAIIGELADEIERIGFTVWFDRELLGGQNYRDVLDQRIDAAKVVVVTWTANSVGSRYVRHEAQRAGEKLICLRQANLDFRKIPGPFAANDHILELGDTKELVRAIEYKMRESKARAARH